MAAVLTSESVPFIDLPFGEQHFVYASYSSHRWYIDDTYRTEYIREYVLNPWILLSNWRLKEPFLLDFGLKFIFDFSKNK